MPDLTDAAGGELGLTRIGELGKVGSGGLCGEGCGDEDGKELLLGVGAFGNQTHAIPVAVSRVTELESTTNQKINAIPSNSTLWLKLEKANAAAFRFMDLLCWRSMIALYLAYTTSSRVSVTTVRMAPIASLAKVELSELEFSIASSNQRCCLKLRYPAAQTGTRTPKIATRPSFQPIISTRILDPKRLKIPMITNPIFAPVSCWIAFGSADSLLIRAPVDELLLSKKAISWLIRPSKYLCLYSGGIIFANVSR